MIITNDMTRVKSNDEVIRSVRFEFNHFSIDKMDILKHMIAEYLETDRATYTLGKSLVTKNGDAFITKRLIDEGVRIYEEVCPVLNIELHMFGKPTKMCVLYVKAPAIIENITTKHIRQCIIKITKKISDDIYNRLKMIDTAETKDNFFVQDIAIWNGDFVGLYDFGTMKVDFGNAFPNRRTYKVARCMIKYTQYRVDITNQPVYSFIERTSKMKLLLLQCFLRVPIYDSSGDVPFISDHIIGQSVSINRYDFGTDYIEDYMNNRIVPEDISSLFTKFEQLREEEKSVYLNALNSYCEGIKTEGSKAISYFVISLETVSSYEAKKKGLKDINKIDMIFDFLQTMFTVCPLEYKTVENFYGVRSAYVHNGIANNDFLDEVFMKSLISNDHRKIIERIANYALIIWLKVK